MTEKLEVSTSINHLQPPTSIMSTSILPSKATPLPSKAENGTTTSTTPLPSTAEIGTTTSTSTFNGRKWLDDNNFNTVTSRTEGGKFPLYVACGHDFFDQDSKNKVGPMSKDEACVVVGSHEWNDYLQYKEYRKSTKATHGSLEAVQWLYNNGAACDLSSLTEEGNTPFRLACYNGNLEICQYLYSKGAHGDISKPNKKGSKPMSAACYEGHINIVKFLLECGCQKDLPGPQVNLCVSIPFTITITIIIPKAPFCVYGTDDPPYVWLPKELSARIYLNRTVGRVET